MTRDEFEQWRAGPLTEEVMRLLRLKADAMEDTQSTALFQSTNADDFEVVRRHAIFVRGQVDILDFITTMTMEDIVGEN